MENKEFEVPALVITPSEAPVITGNYDVIEKTLAQWRDKVASMTLTEDNLEDVVGIKKAAVALRNGLDRTIEAAKKALFNDPKKIFEARVKTLFNLIADVEDRADEVLDKLEQERRDGINEVLDYYKEKFQKSYQLNKEYLARIEYRKNYYNKSIEEKARKDDLEQQFIALKREQDTHEANIRLINSVCEGSPLNPQLFIEQLGYRDVATIVEMINGEKRRLKEINDTPAIEVKKDKKGGKSMKTMDIRITYPSDTSGILNKLFSELGEYGIKIKEL